ncbi:FAD-dependent oxidoreductase [Nesterenkonia halotolerans]|uniref:Glycine/D-amino acid oxidase-like deaminating enzyme/nitrite reductase/ring-hydroxylating ferredoxin subunit n=1 Tax=Nesterenkonia halotolerans TaxID=225325 RepID=A0ABR9J560_9MICC|nr:FAD-dependent oxidoreductase [Nesterenkonia halotolerans]MBE1514129.1 glycine/D-amino acid oxidase-like deaminating enzyme/nitrite reductase/ring-hydroxylating ferredoxin subunit [Nesterenkonia halotolerans]
MNSQTTHSTYEPADTHRSLWLDTHTPESIPTDTFTEGAHYDTVVAGAGLTGLTTAVLLARSGHKVAVLEARSVGVVATGNTTAKLSLLQGTNLSSIRKHHSDEILQAYVDGNQEGQSWLVRYLEEHGVPYQRRTAYTYAATGSGLSSLREELAACQNAGLPVEWTERTDLPFPVSGAIALKDQIQFHPMEVLGALAAELRHRGGELIEGVRVTGASSGDGSWRDTEEDAARSSTDDDTEGSPLIDSAPLTVETSQGSVTASRLMLATGVPVLDRGGYFAKLKPNRSYAMTYRVPGSPASIPEGMYLSADSPGRTLRTVPVNGEELLLIGGNDHVVGRSPSEAAAVQDLEDWAQEHFPGAERTHVWSAQDYRTSQYVPFFGKLPRGGGKIYLATGYNKWGMSNAVAAALAISAQILGGHMAWAETLGARMTSPSDVLTGLKDNAEVGATMVAGWAAAEVHALPKEAPAEGEGAVGREHGKPVAVSTVEGETCKVSAICPHLGGVLKWNDAALSWDCPLHGSRFAADGELLEGPAVTNLSRL